MLKKLVKNKVKALKEPNFPVFGYHLLELEQVCEICLFASRGVLDPSNSTSEIQRAERLSNVG